MPRIRVLEIFAILIIAVAGVCPNTTSCSSGYTCNANGLCIVTQNSIVATQPNISTGAIAGIVLGWLIGLTGLYLLGLWLIFWYFKRRYPQQDNDNPSAGGGVAADRRQVQTELGMQQYVQPGIVGHPLGVGQPLRTDYPSEDDSKYKSKRRKQAQPDIV